MLIPIFVYLWSIYFNYPTLIVGQQLALKQPFDITVGKRRNTKKRPEMIVLSNKSIEIIICQNKYLFLFFSQAVYLLIETKEQIFKIWKAFLNTLYFIIIVCRKMHIIYHIKSVFKKKH